MDIEKLRDYDEWIDKTPEEILNAVIKVGGWAVVFPGSLPLFAHQVRNFFNVEPKLLMRLDVSLFEAYFARIRALRNSIKRAGSPTEIVKEVLALSGDVYKDEQNRIWYQMSPGATIYHWGGDPRVPEVEAPLQSIKGQDKLPIFKLISPDDSGGSHETIIDNIHHRSTIGMKLNSFVDVEHHINKIYKYQGSYNYSETVVAGDAAHVKRDVVPHKKHPKDYLNPEDRFLPLGSRRFPSRKLRDGRQIGYEKGMEPFEFESRPDSPRNIDRFAQQMRPPHYPRNDRRSLDLVKDLEYLFRNNPYPKRLLGRIEARYANDNAAKDFHNPAILDPTTVRRLLKILRDRPKGSLQDVWP